MEGILPINIQMQPLIKEFAIAKEHSDFVGAITLMMPQYLGSLYTATGKDILNKLLGKEEIEGIRKDAKERVKKILDSREPNMMILLEFLAGNAVLEDEKNDKELTKEVALKVLSRANDSIIGGSDAHLRGFSLQRLLRNREGAEPAKREEIDNKIKTILRDDLEAVKMKIRTIRDVNAILRRKKIPVDVLDYVKKEVPPEVLDLLGGKDLYEYIGSHNVEEDVLPQLIDFKRTFEEKIEKIKKLHRTLSNEAGIGMGSWGDAEDRVKDMLENLSKVIKVGENVGENNFYENKVSVPESLLHLKVLNYLFRPLEIAFSMAGHITGRTVDKITPIAKFLSKTEATLVRREPDKKKFEIMDDFLNELGKSTKELDSRVEFGKKLFELSKIAKEIHPNAPAALAKFLNDEKKLGEEIENIVNRINSCVSCGLLPADLDVKARREKTGKIIAELKEKEFSGHIKRMHEGMRPRV